MIQVIIAMHAISDLTTLVCVCSGWARVDLNSLEQVLGVLVNFLAGHTGFMANINDVSHHVGQFYGQ